MAKKKVVAKVISLAGPLEEAQIHVNKKVEFITSEDEHWYPSPTLEGVWYPSVTTIIGDSFPKGIGFQKYLANLSSYDESQDILKAAGKRGTNVHDATERLEKGDTLYRESFTLEEWQMLEGFVKWHKAYNPRAIHIERSFCSDILKTGGTIDRVYEIEGRIVVLDIKTSSAVHQNYWCQTSVYDKLLTEHTTLIADETAILRLSTRKKDGYEYVYHNREEIEEDFKVFQSVQTIWNYRNPKAKPKLLEVPTTLSL